MFLFIDKPKGITSHDVIDRIRKITGEKRVGHAGTLDPNATGLLIVGVSRESTRELWTKFGKLDKTYEAEITLGEEREGDDITGKFLISNFEFLNKSLFTKSPNFAKASMGKQIINNLRLTKSHILKTLDLFLGDQMQVPPDYSAIKIKGKKAYEMARKNQSLSLDPRKVTIYSIKLLEYKYPILKIETKVSSGTYVRSIARDLGRKLGCGAYLSNLRRTRIGKYKVAEAQKLVDLKNSTLRKNSQSPPQNSNTQNI